MLGHSGGMGRGPDLPESTSSYLRISSQAQNTASASHVGVVVIRILRGCRRSIGDGAGVSLTIVGEAPAWLPG